MNFQAITVYIVTNSISLVVVYAFFQFRNVLQACSIPISSPTACLIVFNFGCFGVICLHWKTSKRLHQFYLIMLAALTAIFLVNNMPDWTVWIALMALCAWDVVAVLTPCGPLKMLVETASRRGDDNFPAILYNGLFPDQQVPKICFLFSQLVPRVSRHREVEQHPND